MIERIYDANMGKSEYKLEEEIVCKLCKQMEVLKDKSNFQGIRNTK